MGFVSTFFRRTRAGVQQLPTGTITVDRNGRIISTTVSSAYPKKFLQETGRDVMKLFREARAAQNPMAEINIHFGSLRITARELRGGAIVFLLPQSALMPLPTATRL